MITRKVVLSLTSVLFLFSVNLAYSAQPSNEVQISGQEKDSGVDIPPGENCEFRPIPSCGTRLVCYTHEQIINKSPNSVNMAVRRANNRARNLYISKIGKNPVDLTKKCHEKESSFFENDNGTEKSGSVCDTFTTESQSVQADALEAVATQINVEQKEVGIMIGRTCTGAKAAKQIRDGEDVGESKGSNELKPLDGAPRSRSYQRNDF
jgi:hypothetical protein